MLRLLLSRRAFSGPTRIRLLLSLLEPVDEWLRRNAHLARRALCRALMLRVPRDDSDLVDQVDVV